MASTPESDEVAGHAYRQAQSNRLLRFLRDNGIDERAMVEGAVEVDLDPICDEHGKIVPEPIDFR
jgi:hypothetical protein